MANVNNNNAQKQQEILPDHTHVTICINVETFAASDQWLAVYDTLVSKSNMKALEPLFEEDENIKNRMLFPVLYFGTTKNQQQQRNNNSNSSN